MTTPPTVSESTEGLETQRSEQKPMTRERETIARVQALADERLAALKRNAKRSTFTQEEFDQEVAHQLEYASTAVNLADLQALLLLALGPGEGLRPPITDAWVHSLANLRQGRAATPRCESPGQYELNRCRELISEVLEALPSPPVPNGEGDKEGFMASRGTSPPASAAQDADMWKPCTGCGAEPLQLHREDCSVMLANRPIEPTSPLVRGGE